MPTYWDSFLDEFPETKTMELRKVLEAFFYYTKNQRYDCLKILTEIN